jgi:KaiC/GvpD/RAD55 family RecA-like ATPase
MSTEAYIPRKTIDELSASHQEGSRHAAMIKIAMSLIGNGLPDEAVFATLRSKFPPEKTDKEIRDVIRWCGQKNPTPSKPSFGTAPQPQRRTYGYSAAPTPVAKPALPAPELASQFIDGKILDVEATLARSPAAIGEINTQAEALYTALYKSDDKLNIVCKFTVNDKGKANPKGGGSTRTRDEWIAFFKAKGSPSSEAGAWTRPNPCREGTGADGAITDSDVLRHEFLLIESDTLPLNVQLSLYAKFKLPIAAILTSGGGSAHAWVRLGAPDDPTYRLWAKRILEALAPFGFDQSNKNPSRLSRLPGVTRKIQPADDGVQRLLYLDPLAGSCSDELLAEFEKQVTPPFFSLTPMRSVMRRAPDRYDELINNRDEIGLRTGIADFDKDTGGLKRSQFILLAAETNVGKTTAALNIINHALKDKRPVVLFSLEMDQDEILDILVSMNLKIDRNVFNTGNFKESDIQKINEGGKRIAEFPLYIFDEPTLTIEDIERQSLAVCAQTNVRLIVVDYLQLVLPPVTMRDNREQQIAHIGRTLRMLAKKCKVPVLAVSQLNEEGKIRESRAVAHDAHVVFMLEAESGNMTLRVTKGRSIPKKSYDLYFEPLHCIIAGRSRISDDAPAYQGYSPD